MSIFDALTEKPWLVQGPAAEPQSGQAATTALLRTGLVLFLAVVTSLFALFISAYQMRSASMDWVRLSDPGVLWLNTAVLVLTSLAFERARRAAGSGSLPGARRALALGGVLTLLFLVGQYAAWRELNAAGMFAASNPAYAFFYLLTGVHGLHLAGGLVVWARVMRRAWSGPKVRDVIAAGRLKLSIELCAVYWHYLLLVWVVLFGLLLLT